MCCPGIIAFLVTMLIAISTTLFGKAVCCDLELANNCISQLETDVREWTQSEKCIEFAQNDGNFSQCKKVLESCTKNYILLQRLVDVNVKLASSCTKVCPSYKTIQQRCIVDVQVYIVGNYTEFCSKYEDALNCAKTYQTTCAISSEFHQKAVIKPQMLHTYKTICNKGCATLEFTVKSMETCKWFANRSNCSTVEFDECVQGLNKTLCPEYRRLYAFWFETACEPNINQNETQTESSNDIRTYSTSTYLDAHSTVITESSKSPVHSTSLGVKSPQTDGQTSSSSIQGVQDLCLRITLVAVLTTMFPPDSMMNTL